MKKQKLIAKAIAEKMLDQGVKVIAKADFTEVWKVEISYSGNKAYFIGAYAEDSDHESYVAFIAMDCTGAKDSKPIKDKSFGTIKEAILWLKAERKKVKIKK